MAKSRGRLGAYSRVLQRGVIADKVDGRSREGRIMRVLEKDLVDHVGGKPTIVQRMLIDRMVKSRMQIDLLDEKLAQGSFTPHDQRVYNALHNALRLTARELGLKGAAAKPPSINEYFAAKRAGAVA